MIKVLTKAGSLSNFFRVVTPAINSNIAPPPPAVPAEAQVKMPLQRITTTTYTSACALPNGKLRIFSGPAVKFNVRFSHTDLSVPDFTEFRKSSTTNPNVNNKAEKDHTRLYGCILATAGGAGTMYCAKSIVTMFVSSMAPSAAVMALAKIEVSKSDIPEGKNVTFKWRGKPLFIRHRTDDEIKTEAAVDLSALRDPEPDNARVKEPKWLVVIGVCTHLGCVPVPNQGDWGGYYCPCHGSHYDAAGRIRKGPAPTNLEVPPYEINNETIIVG